MKMPLVHRRMEGEEARNGFNWNRDWASRFVLLIRIPLSRQTRLYYYFRWRSRNIGGTRIVHGWDAWHANAKAFLEVNYDTRTINIGENKLSWELLRDIDSGALKALEFYWRNQGLKEGEAITYPDPIK